MLSNPIPRSIGGDLHGECKPMLSDRTTRRQRVASPSNENRASLSAIGGNRGLDAASRETRFPSLARQLFRVENAGTHSAASGAPVPPHNRLSARPHNDRVAHCRDVTTPTKHAIRASLGPLQPRPASTARGGNRSMKIVSVVPTSRRPLCGSERRFRFFDQSASNGSVVSMFAWRLAGRRGSALGAHRTQPCAARPCGGQLPPAVRWNRRSERGGRCAFRVARQPAAHWNKARHGEAHAVVASTIFRPGRSGREALYRTRQQQPDGVVQMDVGVRKA